MLLVFLSFDWQALQSFQMLDDVSGGAAIQYTFTCCDIKPNSDPIAFVALSPPALQTPSQPIAGNANIPVDLVKHDLNCTGVPLNGFQAVTAPNSCGRSSCFNYNFTCAYTALTPLGPVITSTTASAQCGGGTSISNSLAKLPVSCTGSPSNPNTAFVSGFQLQSSSSNGRYSCNYRYQCIAYSGNFKCRTSFTPLQLFGNRNSSGGIVQSRNDSIAYLRLHNVQCASNEALQSFSVLFNGSLAQYQYTCCQSVQSPGACRLY